MKSFRVLLIDDEEELVSTLVERLEIRGIQAVACTDARAALEKMREAPFEVVAADLKMPGMGGVELIETLCRDYPKTHIILITGHGASFEEREPIPAGVREILLKPFSIDTFVERIRAVMENPV